MAKESIGLQADEHSGVATNINNDKQQRAKYHSLTRALDMISSANKPPNNTQLRRVITIKTTTLMKSSANSY